MIQLKKSLKEPSHSGDIPECDKSIQLHHESSEEPKAQKKSQYPMLKFKERRYQRELCIKALHENVIVYLGTGLGKTFITVLYLREIYYQIKAGLHVVFLAPTQDLTRQQAEYFKKHLQVYRQNIYSGRTMKGELHIDRWQRDSWDSELARFDILFMTPQIFANALQHNLVSWESFAAIIFDECHHAARKKGVQNSHPYSSILKHHEGYYRYKSTSTARPRIIGLTASLINNQPKSGLDIEKEISWLEKDFWAKCVTDFIVQDQRPDVIIQSFLPSQIDKSNHILFDFFSTSSVKLELATLARKIKQLSGRPLHTFSAEDEELQRYGKRLALATAGFSIKPSKFPKVFTALAGILKRCGLWQLHRICSKITVALEKPISGSDNMYQTRAIYCTLRDLLRTIENETAQALQTYPNGGLEQCRSKLYSLLDVLEVEYNRMRDSTSEKETFSCVVFVKSRLEVVAIQTWLHEVSEKIERYKFIKSDYAVGLAATAASTYAFLTKTTPKAQKDKLDKFRSSHLNVIVTTSVLEEGIDLPVCSTVIRYDPPWNFREFAQSRGRARQDKSSFIVLGEEGKLNDEQTRLLAYYSFEKAVRKALESRDIGTASRHSNPLPNQSGQSSLRSTNEDVFILKDGAIRIDGTAAKVILHMYCAYISKRKLFSESATFGRDCPTPSSYQTTLYLPSGCPLVGGIKGGIRDNSLAADNSACVAAIKALYEAKELDENAIPFRLSEKSIDNCMKDAGFNCDIQPLDKELEGLVETSGEKTVYYYPTKMASIMLNQNESEQVRERYKLLGLRFISNHSDNRKDAQCFLERPKYGLIVNTSVSDEFIPEEIYGHYGKYLVEHKTIIDSFEFSDSYMPRNMLRYTHRLLVQCIGLRNISFLDLQRVCRFFIIPLTPDDKLDIAKLGDSFGWPKNQVYIEKGSIVKVRLPVDRFVNQRRGVKDDNRILYVTAHRHDLKPSSQVPGGIRGETFVGWWNRNYPNSSIRTNQRILEVVPISREIARMKLGKSTHRDQTTSSLFYLEDSLEHFDSDAASVFQAFNLPQIIYQLYLNLEAADLDNHFIQATKEKRNLIKVTEQPPENLSILYSSTEQEGIDDNEASVELAETEEQPSEPDSDEDDHQEAAEASDDDDDDERSDIALSSDSEDSLADSSDEHNQRGDIHDVINRQDHSEFKKWDVSDYMKTLDDGDRCEVPITYRSPSWRVEPNIEQETAHFHGVLGKLNDLMNQLVNQLVNLRKETSSARVESEDESSSMNVKVDIVEPPFNLDRRLTPMRTSTRISGVLEALTQRRVGESYNLEALETIGDSYLKYVSSMVLFKRADVKEGLLTAIRSRLTSNKYFTYLAKKSRLGSYAITQGFSPDLLAHILGAKDRNHQRIDKRYLNRLRQKDLADVFESLVGAYLVYQSEYEAILLIEWLGLQLFDQNSFDEIHEKAVVFSRVVSPLIDESGVEDIFEKSKEKITQFEKIIGYTFNDKAFAIQAFSHSSSLTRCTPSYERLEFLGDAILDYLVVLTLYFSGTVNSPGQLTSSKSALVNNCTFAKLALKYKYHQFIEHANIDIHIELSRVQDELEDDPSMQFLDIIDYDSIVKLLADTFESIAAAIYLDSGCSLDAVWRVYYSMMKEYIDSEISRPTKNQVQVLYETFVDGIVFEDFEDQENEGQKCVRLKVTRFGQFEGRGLSKKQAKLRAIQECLKNPVTAEFIEERKKIYAKQVVSRAPRHQRSFGRGGHNSQHRSRSRSQQSSASRR